jgi:predicted dienelactone hydrolase
VKARKRFFFEKKNQKTFVLALTLLVCFARQAFAIGFEIVAVPDPGNPPIEVGIWYPSDAPAHEEQLFLDSQTVAIHGAASGQNLPLILMSHGQGGRFSNQLDTAIALADAGFVAAALTHTGDNLHDQSRVTMIQDRPRQMRVVTDWMLRAWPDHARIDPARIGAFGFSAGGFTVLVAAGGVPDMAALGPHCAQAPTEFTCALIARNHVDLSKLPPIPAAAWVHDSRIRAAVVAAPALGFAFGQAGLAGVHIPIQLWRAEDDHILPHPFYAQAVHDALPAPPDYHVVPNADHLDFLTPCTAEKSKITPQICESLPGFDRAAFHATFNAAVVAFFKTHLVS